MRYGYLLGAGMALAAAISCAPAQAQFYIGAEGGWTSLEDQTGTYGFTKPLPGFKGPALGAKERFDDGFNAGLRGGYMWGHWRLEEEFRYQENNTTGFVLGGKPVPNVVRSEREAGAFMTNLLYDFSLGWPVSPHVGAGVGAVDQRDNLKQVPGVGNLAHGDDWEFGYQGIAGLRWMASPAVALDLDYRYLATIDPTFHTGLIGTYKSGYSSHNVVASITMLFGAPPPPPVVPPAPPPPPPPPQRQVFLVFFDWDKDVITPEGMLILQQAATAWRSGAPIQIQVTGYTDRSGSPGYNQRLSERRANNVASALASLGIPREQMAVSGRGENDNRVPTAPGVREPQNRRVEIVFP